MKEFDMNMVLLITNYVILVGFLVVHYKDLMFTAKSLVKSKRNTNIRAAIFIAIGSIIAFITDKEKYISTLIFNKYVYYGFNICFLLIFFYWLFRKNRLKEKRDPFSKAFINNKLCIEELIIYLMVIVNLFPFGMALTNNNSKFEFKFVLTTSNDFTENANFTPYTNINNKLSITNNSDNVYSVNIDTYYSQFNDLNKDSLDKKIYFFCDFDRLDNGDHYYKHSQINSHSISEFEILKTKVTIPNFLTFPFDVDSTSLLFNKNQINPYREYTKNKYVDIGIKGVNGSKGGAYLIYPKMDNKWAWQFGINWITRVTFEDNEGRHKTFLFKGGFNHVAAIIIFKDANYYVPGFTVDNCMTYPYYYENRKEKAFDLSCFNTRLEIDKAKTLSIYKTQERNWYYEEKKFPELYGESKIHYKFFNSTILYVSNHKVLENLLDKALGNIFISYKDSLNSSRKQ